MTRKTCRPHPGCVRGTQPSPEFRHQSAADRQERSHECAGLVERCLSCSCFSPLRCSPRSRCFSFQFSSFPRGFFSHPLGHSGNCGRHDISGLRDVHDDHDGHDHDPRVLHDAQHDVSLPPVFPSWVSSWSGEVLLLWLL